MEALKLSDAHSPIVKLHPTALMSILHSYSRRHDREARVIGTLLGSVKGDVIEVTDCFGFPHHENLVDEKMSVTLDIQMSQAMYACHRRMNKQEQIVGWYATTSAGGAFITEYSSLIHDFYAGQCKNPIHLVVDTTLSGDNIDVRGFVSQPMTVDGNVLASVFDDVKVSVDFSPAEATCLYHMINGQGDKPFSSSTVISRVPSDKERLENSMEKTLKVLENLQKYLDGIESGSITPTAEVGIAISDALVGLKLIKPEDLTAFFNEKKQDLLMVSYLASHTQTQLKIAEKLNSVM
jgi:translation initiation factor 3 subunit F